VDAQLEDKSRNRRKAPPCLVFDGRPLSKGAPTAELNPRKPTHKKKRKFRAEKSSREKQDIQASRSAGLSISGVKSSPGGVSTSSPTERKAVVRRKGQERIMGGGERCERVPIRGGKLSLSEKSLRRVRARPGGECPRKISAAQNPNMAGMKNELKGQLPNRTAACRRRLK